MQRNLSQSESMRLDSADTKAEYECRNISSSIITDESSVVLQVSSARSKIFDHFSYRFETEINAKHILYLGYPASRDSLALWSPTALCPSANLIYVDGGIRS